MKIHYGVIVAWIGSVGVYEACNRLINSYGLATVLTVVVLFGALWLEDKYGTETKSK
jgi:hypothetical protein